MRIIRQKEFGKNWAYTLQEKRDMNKVGSIENVNEKTKANQEIVDMIKDHPKFNKNATTEEITALMKSFGIDPEKNSAQYVAILKALRQ